MSADDMKVPTCQICKVPMSGPCTMEAVVAPGVPTLFLTTYSCGKPCKPLVKER